MRPNPLAFLLVLGLSTSLFSQTEAIPKHYELKGQAYAHADSILDLWSETEFYKILGRNKLKMSCANRCDAIYMDVIFMIDLEGNLASTTMVKSNKCGEEFSEKLKNEFIAFFTKIKFPSSLRNMRVQFRLGTALKC